jgi:uncharacterized membrane protein YkoI
MIKKSYYHCSILILTAISSFASNPKTKLTMEAAKNIALSKEPGHIKSQELEKEKGRWIYSFDIEKDNHIHEVNVDANNGDVVEDSVENPADEAKENASKKIEKF